MKLIIFEVIIYFASLISECLSFVQICFPVVLLVFDISLQRLRRITLCKGETISIPMIITASSRDTSSTTPTMRVCAASPSPISILD